MKKFWVMTFQIFEEINSCRKKNLSKSVVMKKKKLFTYIFIFYSPVNSLIFISIQIKNGKIFFIVLIFFF